VKEKRKKSKRKLKLKVKINAKKGKNKVKMVHRSNFGVPVSLEKGEISFKGGGEGKIWFLNQYVR
jgi:hypothetical protein